MKIIIALIIVFIIWNLIGLIPIEETQ